MNHFTAVRIARYDGNSTRFRRPQHGFVKIQPQSGLASVGVKPMTLPAVFREDRANVTIELQSLVSTSADRDGHRD